MSFLATVKELKKDGRVLTSLSFAVTYSQLLTYSLRRFFITNHTM